MINESLRKSWPIIDLCESQEKKMKGKCTWQKLKRINIISIIKTKPGAIGTLPWRFSLTPAQTLFLLCFFRLGPTWLMVTKSGLHMQHATVIFVFTLFLSLKSKAIQHMFNYTKYPKLQRTEVRKRSIQPPPCHYSPSPRINTRHTHLALPI